MLHKPLGRRAMRILAVVGFLFLGVSCRPAGDPETAQSSPRDTQAVIVLPTPSEAPGSPNKDAAASQCTPIWPARVWLSGNLNVEKKWGPPGYGETPDRDELLTIFVLELDQPEDVCGETATDQDGPTTKRVDRVQLTGAFNPTRL